jgi:hypothetical protein
MKKTILGLAALAAVFSTAAYADDAVFTLTNNSSYQIDAFFASPANDDQWGDDILGQDVLAGGQNGTVTIPGGSPECIYDLKAVDETGAEHVLEDLNICESPAVTFDK